MADQILKVSCQQAAVTLIALLSLVGVIVCTVLRIPVPDVLMVALTSSLGAQFGMTLPASRGGKE